MIQRRAVRLATNAVQRVVFARVIIEHIKIVLFTWRLFLGAMWWGGGLQHQHMRLRVGRAVTYVEIVACGRQVASSNTSAKAKTS